jgi:hypothetical protein
LIGSLGAATKDIEGAYCTKDGTAYTASAACVQACDPSAAPCP